MEKYSFNLGNESVIVELDEKEFDELPISKQANKKLLKSSTININSKVKYESLQHFINFLIDGSLDVIEDDDLLDCIQLSKEIGSRKIQKTLNSHFSKLGKNDIIIDELLNELNEAKDNSALEEQIAINLTYHLNKNAKKLRKVPITSLVKIFSHPNRSLANHDIAYKFIIDSLSDTDDSERKNFCLLLPSLDGTAMSEEIINDAIAKTDLHYGFKPKMPENFFAKLKEKVDNCDNKFTILNDQFEDIKQTYQTICNSKSSFNELIEKVKSEQKSQFDQFTAQQNQKFEDFKKEITSSIIEINSKQSQIEKNLTNFQLQQTQLSQNIDTLKQQQQENLLLSKNLSNNSNNDSENQIQNQIQELSKKTTEATSILNNYKSVTKELADKIADLNEKTNNALSSLSDCIEKTNKIEAEMMTIKIQQNDQKLSQHQPKQLIDTSSTIKPQVPPPPPQKETPKNTPIQNPSKNPPQSQNSEPKQTNQTNQTKSDSKDFNLVKNRVKEINEQNTKSKFETRKQDHQANQKGELNINTRKRKAFSTSPMPLRNYSIQNIDPEEIDDKFRADRLATFNVSSYGIFDKYVIFIAYSRKFAEQSAKLFEIKKSNPNIMLGIELLGKTTLPDKIPNFENFEYIRIGENVQLPSSYFASSLNLRAVEIIKPMKIIPSKLFMGCENIELVTFVTKPFVKNQVDQIQDFAFCGCSKLTEILIPETLLKIGASAFEKCISLKKVTFQYSNTMIDIGPNAFNSCTGLETISIPPNVKHIGPSCFAGCDHLREVSIPSALCKNPDELGLKPSQIKSK